MKIKKNPEGVHVRGSYFRDDDGYFIWCGENKFRLNPDKSLLSWLKRSEKATEDEGRVSELNRKRLGKKLIRKEKVK